MRHIFLETLSDRARREVSAYAREPVLGGIMVNMILNEQAYCDSVIHEKCVTVKM